MSQFISFSDLIIAFDPRSNRGPRLVGNANKSKFSKLLLHCNRGDMGRSLVTTGKMEGGPSIILLSEINYRSTEREKYSASGCKTFSPGNQGTCFRTSRINNSRTSAGGVSRTAAYCTRGRRRSRDHRKLCLPCANASAVYRVQQFSAPHIKNIIASEHGQQINLRCLFFYSFLQQDLGFFLLINYELLSN